MGLGLPPCIHLVEFGFVYFRAADPVFGFAVRARKMVLLVTKTGVGLPARINLVAAVI